MARRKKNRSGRSGGRRRPASAAGGNREEAADLGAGGALEEPLLPACDVESSAAAAAAAAAFSPDPVLSLGADAKESELLPVATEVEPLAQDDLEAALLSDAASFNLSHCDEGGGGGGGDPPATPASVLHVVSPADLPAGFRFVATVSAGRDEGRAFVVAVPEGGAAAGSTIAVPHPPREFLATTALPPTGTWKDGLCSCLRHGLCHPSACLPGLLPLASAGQVYGRMGLNWLGARAGTWGQARAACAVLTLLTVADVLGQYVLQRLYDGAAYHARNGTAATYLTLQTGLGVAFGIFSVYTVARARNRVRARYSIPPSTCCCGPLEDACCALTCGCCSLAQAMRHTADYETYRGAWCSPTGLPASAPAVV